MSQEEEHGKQSINDDSHRKALFPGLFAREEKPAERYAAIVARLEKVPASLVVDDGLTFTRLHDEGGALHTGGGDGIVYAGAAVASIDNCPPARDAFLEVIANAPSDLAWALRELRHAKRALEFYARMDVYQRADSPAGPFRFYIREMPPGAYARDYLRRWQP